MNYKSTQNSGTNLIRPVILSSTLVFLFLLLSSGLYAQTNFSGSWSFNESKSKLGDENGPRMASTILNITQQGNVMSIDRTQPSFDGSEIKTSEKYTLDGKESTNQGMMNSIVKSIVTWTKDQKELNFSKTISVEMNGEKNEFKSTEAWSMAADGKTLTIESNFSSPMGEMKTTLVYDKK